MGKIHENEVNVGVAVDVLFCHHVDDIATECNDVNLIGENVQSNQWPVCHLTGIKPIGKISKTCVKKVNLELIFPGLEKASFECSGIVWREEAKQLLVNSYNDLIFLRDKLDSFGGLSDGIAEICQSLLLVGQIGTYRTACADQK